MKDFSSIAKNTIQPHHLPQSLETQQGFHKPFPSHLDQKTSGGQILKLVCSHKTSSICSTFNSGQQWLVSLESQWRVFKKKKTRTMKNQFNNEYSGWSWLNGLHSNSSFITTTTSGKPCIGFLKQREKGRNSIKREPSSSNNLFGWETATKGTSHDWCQHQCFENCYIQRHFSQ